MPQSCAPLPGAYTTQLSRTSPLHFGLQVIPAFEEAVAGMKTGGVRRIVVPPEIGYPDNDFKKQGPVPTTFSVSTVHALPTKTF